MTIEELLELEPGDKLTYDVSALDPETHSMTIKELTNYFDKYDYFIFRKVSLYESAYCKFLDGRTGSFALIKNIKLYKPRPWSYERDY